MKVQSSLLDRLTEIAEHEDRPIGYVARELMLRGLNLYESDARLRDSAVPQTAGEPAPIVARIERAAPAAEVDDREAIRMQLENELQPERKRKAG